MDFVQAMNSVLHRLLASKVILSTGGFVQGFLDWKNVLSRSRLGEAGLSESAANRDEKIMR